MALNEKDSRELATAAGQRMPRLDQQIDAAGWEVFIETLLSGLKIEYELEVTEDRLNIKTNSEDAKIIQERLESAYQSPAFFVQQFHLKLVGADGNIKPAPTVLSTPTSDAADSDRTRAPELKDSVEEGINRFRKLFGTMRSIGGFTLDVGDLFNEREGAHSKDGVLYSKPVRGARQTRGWKAFLEVLLPRFVNVTPEVLKKIWLEEDAHLPEAPELLEDEALEGPIQRFFRIETQNGESRLAFDYRGLQNHLFNPVFSFPVQPVENSKKDEVVISVSRPELFRKTEMVAKQIVEDTPFIMRVYKKDGQLKANPVFLVASEPAKRQRIHFVVDCSRSMGALIEKLKNDILNMIKQLGALDNSMEVKIILFADDTITSTVYKIDQTSAIQQFLMQPHTGGTHLYAAIDGVLQSIREEQSLGIDNTVIAFTDGFDISNWSPEVFHRSVIGKKDNPSLKRFFPVGIGSGHDRNTMVLLGDIFNTPYIYQEKPEDFRQIYDHVNQIRHSAKVFDVIMRNQQRTKARYLTIPVTLDGNPNEVMVEFPFEEHETVVVEINGKEFSFTVEDASKVPEATVRDLTNELLQSMRLVVSSNEAASKKVEKLRRVYTQIGDLNHRVNLSKTHQTMVNKAQTKIKYYLDRLAEAVSKNDESIHAGLKSAAKNEMGYREGVEYTDNVRVGIDAYPAAAPSFMGIPMAQAAPLSMPSRMPRSWAEWDALDNLSIHSDADIEVKAKEEKIISLSNAQKPQVSQKASSKQTMQTASMDQFEPALYHNGMDGVENTVGVFVHRDASGQTFLFGTAKQTKTPMALSSPVPVAPMHAHTHSNTNANANANANANMNTQTHNISLDRSTCRPVEFHGKPSSYCEGSGVSVIHTPTLPAPPTGISDSNIMLGAVAFHWAKSLWNWGKGFLGSNASVAEKKLSAEAEILRKSEDKAFEKMFKEETQTLKKKLKEVKVKIITLTATWGNKTFDWAMLVVEEHEAHLQDLITRGNTTETRAALTELQADVLELEQDVKNDIPLREKAFKTKVRLLKGDLKSMSEQVETLCANHPAVEMISVFRTRLIEIETGDKVGVRMLLRALRADILMLRHSIIRETNSKAREAGEEVKQAVEEIERMRCAAGANAAVLSGVPVPPLLYHQQLPVSAVASNGTSSTHLQPLRSPLLPR